METARCQTTRSITKNKKTKFSHPQKQPKVRKMGTMVQHPFKFRKSHKLRNYGFFDVRGLFTEDWRQLFISVGAPNVKSPLKMSAVSAQISAGSRFRKSLLHGRLTKFLYSAVNYCSLIAYKTNGHKRPPTFINREFWENLCKTHAISEILAFSVRPLFWRAYAISACHSLCKSRVWKIQP